MAQIYLYLLVKFNLIYKLYVAFVSSPKIGLFHVLLMQLS